MKTLKIAYFNQLGRKDLDRVVDQFTQKYPDIKISLIGMGHDEVFDKLAELRSKSCHGYSTKG